MSFLSVQPFRTFAIRLFWNCNVVQHSSFWNVATGAGLFGALYSFRFGSLPAGYLRTFRNAGFNSVAFHDAFTSVELFTLVDGMKHPITVQGV